jgi:DNA polymerase III subunit delta
VAEEMLPAYLIAGTDSAKIDSTRSRLRSRAEAEGGAAALEVFDTGAGRGAPDAAALVATIPAMSLAVSRRYLLVDGVERWSEPQLGEVAAGLAAMPPDLTVVLIARGKPPAALSKAVTSAGGEVREFEAPRTRELPGRLVEGARRRGFVLEPAAARTLVGRMGPSGVRLENELDRLALWAGPDGEVGESDLEAMIADTSETAAWSLSDALLERDPARAMEICERLVSQGENVTGLVYALASRLRKANLALAQLESGVAPKKVESSLGMHPYAAKQLVARLRDSSTEELREATIVLADLEVWCRGGSEYGEELALTLALRRASGAEGGTVAA